MKNILAKLTGRLCVLLLAYSLAFPVFAEPLFQFQNLTKKEGLSSSAVYQTVEDKSGFIWFATEDGLQKYDGFEFVTYRFDRADPYSLSNNIVRTLLVDKSGALWVGTDRGLNLYSQNFDHFIRFKHNPDIAASINSDHIRSLSQSSDGTIWVGTSAGLNKIDPETRKVTAYPHFKVRSIFEDDHRQLWIGTLNHGLFLFNRLTGDFKPIGLAQSTEGGSSSLAEHLSIVDIYQDTFERVLVATWGNGVLELQRDRSSLVNIPLALPSQYVRSIHQDTKGALWFGTKQGILVYESGANTSQTIRSFDQNDASLIIDNITDLFQGSDETLWVATYGGGVGRYFPRSRRFETYGMHPTLTEGLVDPGVFAMSEAQDGKVWLGSETGKLARFDPAKKSFEHFPAASLEQVNDYSISALHQFDEQHILIATLDGLYRYNFKTQVLDTFVSQTNPLLAKEQAVHFIEEDPLGRFWIGMQNVGVIVVTSTGEGQLSEQFIEALTLDDPSAIHHVSNGRSLLAGLNSGAKELLFNNNEKQIEGLKIQPVEGTQGANIYDINVDWIGRIWIATLSNGIKIIGNQGRFTSLDEVNGLPNNNVYSVIADANSHKIWATTNSGLVSINPDTLQLVNFTHSDGLQNDEFNSPGFLSSTGYLYFGGPNGFNRFYPNLVQRSLPINAPKLVSLSIANQQIKIADDGLLKTALAATDSLSLNFDQTPFSIAFTSPQFIKPDSLVFRYRLLGLHDNWILAAKKQRSATYTNIKSGDFRFEVQVGSNDGRWFDTIKGLSIEVIPPWWNTLMAKLIYVAISILSLTLIIFFVYRKRKKERLSQITLQENAERLKLSLWGSGYEFWDWDIDSGKISRSNEFKKIEINCPLVSKNLQELACFIHPDDLLMVREKLSHHIAGQSQHFDACYRVVDAENGWRWIQDKGKVVARNNAGIALRMSGTQCDVTNIREKEVQFDMLGQAFKSTSDGVWIRDHEWRLVECNPAYERITGFSLEEKKHEAIWFPEIQEQPANLIQRIRISLEEKGNWQGEAWAERKNNDPFPQKLSIDTLHDEKGNVRYYVGVFSDITFHKRTEEEFRKLANYDSLTGLPNRACLYDRLNQTIEKTKRDKGRFALFLIDIDNFKRINDSLGHSVGDHLIRQVGARLVNCNKEGDTVARIGGDEFVIVIENIRSSTNVATFSELMLKELNQPIFVKGQQLKLNFSIGITLSPDDGLTAERLMRNADTAMYEAKKSVENSYRFYSVEFNERARKRLSLETALRKAIEDETIELYYQPKVDLRSGRVDGVEALARWTHKELGFISPVEFIPLAEETGLIVPLGALLLKQAIRQTKKWVDEGVMRGRTSVNLSAHQFWNKNFATETAMTLKNEGLEAKYIELEITESACMQDVNETQAQIKTLKNVGFRLALDDFGTGYSSLAQLKSLPFDTLKVDKSFVDNIETDPQDAKVVKAIIDIAKTMDMEVVIEGVESKKQCEQLWLSRAYIIQGYYFSRPLRANLCAETFNRHWHKQEYLGKLSSKVTPLGN